jgi:hypothetical protein
MQTNNRPMLWTGRALSALFVLFWLMDLTMKLLDLEVVRSTSAQLGLPPAQSQLLGAIELACLVLYVFPRTSILGAVLVTGYLGGAVATHLRVGSPLFSHVLFGVYVGLMAWGGLWLREPRLRAVFPWLPRA